MFLDTIPEMVDISKSYDGLGLIQFDLRHISLLPTEEHGRE
jgi:hypothetical protein